jgi:hypothetical protein
VPVFNIEGACNLFGEIRQMYILAKKYLHRKCRVDSSGDWNETEEVPICPFGKIFQKKNCSVRFCKSLLFIYLGMKMCLVGVTNIILS